MDEPGTPPSGDVRNCQSLLADRAIRPLQPWGGYIRGSCAWGSFHFYSDLNRVQVLYGEPPYHNTADCCAIMMVLEGHQPRKPEGAESLGFTDELWAMVQRCWWGNRARRPEMGEILRCLESAAQAWDTRPPLPHRATGNDSSHDEDYSSLTSTPSSETSSSYHIAL